MSSPASPQLFIRLIVCLWLLVPASNIAARLLLPASFYVYREWEFMTATEGRGPFKPSTVFRARIYGDLANMLHIREFRRYRQQTFTTDSAGFRNPESTPGTYFPVVVVGDSDMAGSSLTDEETFSHVLGKKLGIQIYNYAPASIPAFLADERFQKNPPKVVIWEAIERTISANTFKPYGALPRNARFTSGRGASKNPPGPHPRLTDFLAKDLYHEIVWRLCGHHESSIDHIDLVSGMLFYLPGVQMLQQVASQRGLPEVITGVDRIRQLLADRGIALIFLPLPDKENIYQELLPTPAHPSEQPAFLEQLIVKLRDHDINTIDLYKPFRSAAPTFIESRREDDSLYFLDDTHWNGQGVALAVEETFKHIKELPRIPSLMKNPDHALAQPASSL